MKRCIMFVAGTAVLACGATASAQSLSDQKTAAEIAKIQVETEKAKVDMEKARIDADNALFNVIRSATGGSAAVAGGEKTAEGLLISKASLAGASARIVDTLPGLGYAAGPDVQPVIIWGSAPPSVAQWLLFKEERAKLAKQFADANAAWAETKSGKMAFLPAAAAVATLVATVIPLFKTDTTLAGGTVSFDEQDARASLAAALQQATYGTLTTLRVADGAALSDTLLSPLADAREAARAAYEDEYMAFMAGKLGKGAQADKIRAAADKLKAALDAHKALRGQLLADTGGILAASVIDRQRQLHTNPAKHPLIYLLNVDAAYTATTKKGLFTGLGGKVPAFGSVSTIIDYAIVGPHGETRGAASCTIANKPMTALLGFDPATYTSKGVALCSAVTG